MVGRQQDRFQVLVEHLVIGHDERKVDGVFDEVLDGEHVAPEVETQQLLRGLRLLGELECEAGSEEARLEVQVVLLEPAGEHLEDVFGDLEFLRVGDLADGAALDLRERSLPP